MGRLKPDDYPRQRKEKPLSVPVVAHSIARLFDNPVEAERMVNRVVRGIMEDESGRFEDVKGNIVQYLDAFLENQKILAERRKQRGTPSPVSLLEFHLEEWVITVKSKASDEEIQAARDSFNKRVNGNKPGRSNGQKPGIPNGGDADEPEVFEAALDELKIPEAFEEFVAREVATIPDPDEEL